LRKAGLITEQQIISILEEQSKCWIKFGEVAVLNGFINYETLNFFKNNFFSDDDSSSRLGTMLKEAGFISEQDLEAILKYQEVYSKYRIGEIIVNRGLVKQETVEFFATDFPKIKKTKNLRLGACLKRAGLLNDNQISFLLKQQNFYWMKFGKTAVSLGYIKQETLDFFKAHGLRLKENTWEDYRIIN
jgi:hypothetical protein